LQAIAKKSAAIAFPEDITQILTMKHSDWLRLQSEGESICATLRQQGYLCSKQTRRLSWKLCQVGQDDYVLAWLPAPVSDWTLIPNDTSPQREKLWQLIERTLTSIRGEVMKTPKNIVHKLKTTPALGQLCDFYLMPDGIQWRDSTTARMQKIIDAFSTASCLPLNLQSSLMFPTNSFNTQLANKKNRPLA
jgi:hypothetical protein